MELGWAVCGDFLPVGSRPRSTASGGHRETISASHRQSQVDS